MKALENPQGDRTSEPLNQGGGTLLLWLCCVPALSQGPRGCTQGIPPLTAAGKAAQGPHCAPPALQGHCHPPAPAARAKLPAQGHPCGFGSGCMETGEDPSHIHLPSTIPLLASPAAPQGCGAVGGSKGLGSLSSLHQDHKLLLESQQLQFSTRMGLQRSGRRHLYR